jgi:hypothetical protein
MSDPLEIEFEFNKMFNPNETLSLFILKLAMARNDLFQNQKHLQIATDIPFNQGESLYFLRIGMSHLREAFKLIHLFSNETTVVSFIKSLDEKIWRQFNEILNFNKEFEDPNSFFQTVLKSMRDESFHYYTMRKGKRNPEYEKQFIDQLDSFTNKKFHIVIRGKKRHEIDFVFANEIMFHLLFGPDVTLDELSENISRLAELNNLFLTFSDDLVAYYLMSKDN